MAKATKLKILYGEGDAEAQAAPAAAFEQAGHMVHKALGRKAVVDALNTGAFDLVIGITCLTWSRRPEWRRLCW